MYLKPRQHDNQRQGHLSD